MLVEEEDMENTFKVGDKVKVVGYKDKKDAPIYWTSDLEKSIGTITTVTHVYKSSKDVDLYGYGYIFPISSLRLLDREKEQEKKIMFKIGDRVKVVKKVTERTEDFQNCWAKEMDEHIGKTFTIESISNYGISFSENANYSFPPASLELSSYSENANEVPEPELRKEEDKKFNSLSELLHYLADGNIIVDTTRYILYKVDDDVLKTKEVGESVWRYCSTSLEDCFFYNKIGKAEPEWYEQEFKPCLCYVWDEDESQCTRVAIVEGYDKNEDYPFQTSGDWFHFAKPLTLAEVTMYWLECA